MHRLMTIAVYLAEQKPEVSNCSNGGHAVASSKVIKADAMHALVCQHSHPFIEVQGGRKCTRCPLFLPSAMSVAHATEVIAIPCPGRRHAPEFRLMQEDLDDHSSELPVTRMYGKLQVHVSHVMASSAATHAFFCTKCGSWGKSRSKKLREACSQPTTAGRDALKRFAKGKLPVTGR